MEEGLLGLLGRRGGQPLPSVPEMQPPEAKCVPASSEQGYGRRARVEAGWGTCLEAILYSQSWFAGVCVFGVS